MNCLATGKIVSLISVDLNPDNAHLFTSLDVRKNRVQFWTRHVCRRVLEGHWNLYFIGGISVIIAILSLVCAVCKEDAVARLKGYILILH